MNKLMLLAGFAAFSISLAAPAQATKWGSSSWGGSSGKPGSSTSTGGHTSTSTGGTTSTGGSSGSTSVPEPGQLGLFAGGIALIAARRLRRGSK